jgi:hypothetical protein
MGGLPGAIASDSACLRDRVCVGEGIDQLQLLFR